MRSSIISQALRAGGWLALAGVLWSGCLLAPRGLPREQARLAEAGRLYEAPPEERAGPALPPEPDWRDVLERAFLASGALEAAYFEWKAALARVGIAAAYPNTNVAVGFEYLFSGGNMKAWDRTTINVGFDPMQNLSFPTKVLAAGRVAFEDARAAGERLRAAKFDLQRRVLAAFADYALLAERLRVQREHVALLGLAAAAARARADAGERQQTRLAADLALHLAENELADLEAEVPRLRAGLNALMARGPSAPLPLPRAVPERRIEADDAALLAAGVERNPALAALAHRAAGRKDALDLARLQYIPDINPFAGITGSMEQAAGAMLSVAATLPRIRAGIEEARAMMRAAEAELRQARLDGDAELVAALYALRNREREVALFEGRVLPVAARLAADVRRGYEAGRSGIAELIEAERAVLDLRLLIAEGRAARERHLAELEVLAGVDIETVRAAAPARDEASAARLAREEAGS
jgi:cobalt-zinc-cadmium efflux system outer membrane protein